VLLGDADTRILDGNGDAAHVLACRRLVSDGLGASRDDDLAILSELDGAVESETGQWKNKR
jgi:hypothetical protein